MKNLKPLKSTNDFIIGTLFLILGIYVLTTNNILLDSIGASQGTIWIIRPDIYVRGIGCLITAFSVILVLKSINWKRSEETTKFTFAMSKEVLLSIGALIIYAFIFPRVGFALSSFLLIFFLTFIYMCKEMSGKQDKITKKDRIKYAIYSVIYAAILVTVVYLIFSKILYVVLP